MRLIKLKGHSGFDLEIKKENNRYIFSKSTKTKPHRLFNQCNKQKQFYSSLPNKLQSIISIPCVLSSSSNKEFSFDMTYHNGKTILDIIEYDTKDKIDFYLDTIFKFIDWEFSIATKSTIVSKPFTDKLDNINLEDKDLDEQIRHLIPKRIILPMGLCHGDLTFSNMIFSSKIILIDFLDSFIETPVQDIGKLYQEICLQWTKQMDNKHRDTCKLNIGYKYISKKINKYINDLEIKENTKTLFKIFTLLRLLPYTTNKKLRKKIQKEIRRLL